MRQVLRAYNPFQQAHHGYLIAGAAEVEHPARGCGHPPLHKRGPHAGEHRGHEQVEVHERAEGERSPRVCAHLCAYSRQGSRSVRVQESGAAGIVGCDSSAVSFDLYLPDIDEVRSSSSQPTFCSLALGMHRHKLRYLSMWTGENVWRLSGYSRSCGVGCAQQYLRCFLHACRHTCIQTIPANVCDLRCLC